MKANELRVGDYVYLITNRDTGEKRLVKVTGLLKTYVSVYSEESKSEYTTTYEYIEPIPIDDDFIAKNFRGDNTDIYFRIYYYRYLEGKSKCFIEYRGYDGSRTQPFTNVCVYIGFIHQLQQVFSFLGIDKQLTI